MTGRRVVAGLAGTAGALAALVVLGGGWVYSGQLLPAPSRDRTLDVTAMLTDRGTVLLPADRRACLQRFGLLLEDAFLVYAGPVVAGSCDGTSGTVERRIEAVLGGTPQVERALAARFDAYASLDAADQVDVAVSDVDVPLEDGLGSSPAWLVEGGEDWVIAVHGRSGSRGEVLRVLPTLAEGGRSVLVVTHRNDMAGGPLTTDRVGRFGQTEWRDLAAAVRFAHQHGAQRIVLMGYSQGASLISYYLRNVGEDEVDGVILDSPLLSLGSTLEQQARLRGIAEPLIPPVLLGTRLVARVRAGFDIGDVEHVLPLAGTTLPMLLIHGPEDDFVPLAPTDELAARRPADLVYERMEGAGHTEGWNTDRERYTDAVASFLADVLGQAPG